MTGSRIDAAELDQDYWFRNLRETVQFVSAVEALAADGHRIFVEASPHPALLIGLQDTLAQSDNVTGGADGAGAAVVGSLRRDHGGWTQFACSAAEAFAAGAPVDWSACFAGQRPRWTPLPTYAFQRRHFWLPSVAAGTDATDLGLGNAAHPLLGAVVESAESGGAVLTGRLSLGTHAWLADHALSGQVVFPGAGFVELAVRAGGRRRLRRAARVDDLHAARVR